MNGKSGVGMVSSRRPKIGCKRKAFYAQKVMLHLCFHTFKHVVSILVVRVFLSNWQLTFPIPEKEYFSGSVQASIKTGIVTSKARRNIIQTLRALMMVQWEQTLLQNS